MTAAAALFETVCEQQDFPTAPEMAELSHWAARFAAQGWTPSYGPGDHDNMSCRIPGGMLVTARETEKATLQPAHFVVVTAVEQASGRPIVRYRGVQRPSTDALLHWRVYQQRADVGAILHGHDTATPAAAEGLGLPVTQQSAQVASAVLLEEALRLCREHDYVLLREHGFLAMGRTIPEAGALAHAWSQRAAGLLK